MRIRTARQNRKVAFAFEGAAEHECSEHPGRRGGHRKRFGLWLAAVLVGLPVAAQGEPAGPPPSALMTPPAAPVHTLEALIDVPDLAPRRSYVERTDELIAAAVEAGTNPDLEPLKPFRKKKFDLFRTEREVEIGNRQMLLRFRLRVKKKETVRLELRF